MTALDFQIERLSKAPRLLVGCDYDGVLAPIVGDPGAARPLEGAVECLVALARVRQTDVAIVSGRALASLRAMIGQAPGIAFVGSHGAEWEGSPGHQEPAAPPEARAALAQALRAVAERYPGGLVEEKPGAVALHYREVAAELRARADADARAAAGAVAGLTIRRGRKVVEFSFSIQDKGQALKRLRHATGATSVLFLGDDITDEDAFATLGDPDAGVSVGGRRSGAAFDLPDPGEALRRLRRLLELRQAWALATLPAPIEHHSMLTDQRTSALVSPRGSIVWLCAPRVDSPALFAELLGPRLVGTPPEARSAGEFAVGEVGVSAPVAQSYVGDSFVLQTRWPSFTVTDYLDCSGGRPFQRAGRTDLVRVIEGRGRARVVFSPRPDFGRSAVTLLVKPGGLVVEGQPDPVVLFAPGVEWRLEADGHHQTAVAEIELGQAPVALELRVGNGSLRPAVLPESARREQTHRLWSAWANSLRPTGRARELVRRSALAIKGLVHGPTGAILAACTTGLPEWPGGVRNWDYRFCWLRDACLGAASLVRLGNTGQAMRLLDWLLSLVDQTGSPERLRPIYTVTGQELGPEADLSELAGYSSSRPVRLGNSAGQQVQLDMFGPVVDLVWRLAESGAPVSPDHWRLVEAMALAVQRRWHEPDHGIWEIRGARRHYVHSKVMCWVAVDRAIRLADVMMDQVRNDWITLRDTIRDDVLAKGWDPSRRAFVLSYEQREIGAACLHVGLSGLLTPTDERFLGTIAAVESHLKDGPAVFRYNCDDGLPGKEGGFLICLGWLIEAKVLAGRVEEAERLFEQLQSLAGPTGLFAEQVDPRTGLGLGNFPQVYSHSALIDSAVALDSVAVGP